MGFLARVVAPHTNVFPLNKCFNALEFSGRDHVFERGSIEEEKSA
jgi:hypothetical protein